MLNIPFQSIIIDNRIIIELILLKHSQYSIFAQITQNNIIRINTQSEYFLISNKEIKHQILLFDGRVHPVLLEITHPVCP